MSEFLLGEESEFFAKIRKFLFICHSCSSSVVKGIMSKIWSLLILFTILLAGGTWYLWTNQLAEEQSEDVGYLQVSPELPEAVDTQNVRREVTLFVGDPATGNLVRTIAELDGPQTVIRKLTQTIGLLMHPTPETSNVAIPDGAELIGVFFTNSGILYLNFNRHLQDRHVGGLSAELVTVASVVNTVFVNFQEVKQVQILVEGNEIDTLVGHIDCRKPFTKMLLLDS